jgi:hypothetical protein
MVKRDFEIAHPYLCCTSFHFPSTQFPLLHHHNKTAGITMSPLSLLRLQELLAEDAEAGRKEAEREARHAAACRPLRDAVDEFWRRHGVLDPTATRTAAGAADDSPADDNNERAADPAEPFRAYQRPIPDSLFQSPLSEPRTTLVRYNRLPRPVQLKLGLSSLAPDAPDLVEIPRSLLEPGDLSLDSAAGKVDNDAAAATSSTTAAPHRRRPVQGNLTSKLSEYTRGLSGQARPFRPGGLGPAPTPPSANESSPEDLDQDESLRAAAAVERSRRVLQIGSRAAWEEGGLLLTAPPSGAAAVNFKVGLSYKDVYGTEDDEEVGEEKEVDADDVMVVDEDNAMTSFNEARSSGAQRLQSAPLFSAAFLDDDSLFGSSSSDEESSVGTDDASDEGQKSATPLAASARGGDAAATSELAKAIAQLEVSADADEVDALLLDLSLTDPSSLRKPARQGSAAAPFSNPIELAERRAKDQADGHRKSWAHTELLPIRDWDATVPNPALTYPFALDDFQQQAIARLERSESVFVAAHTSAGKTVGTTNINNKRFCLSLVSMALRVSSLTPFLLPYVQSQSTLSLWPSSGPRDACTRPPSRRCPTKSSGTFPSSSGRKT